MHALTPRHRRKAGSGPPARALIAWIGADPRLRSVAEASRRRETDLPPPATTRTARAAVIACMVLACGAVLGVADTVNDGNLAPPQNSTTLALSQNSATAPDQETSAVSPVPVTSPTPLAHGISPPHTTQPNGPQPRVRPSRRYQ